MWRALNQRGLRRVYAQSFFGLPMFSTEMLCYNLKVICQLTHEIINCLANGFNVCIRSLSKGINASRSNEVLSVTIS